MHRNLSDSYKLYKDKTKGSFSVCKRDYIKIVHLYIKFIMSKVIDDGDEVVLPFKTGTLYVIGLKQKIKFNDDGTIKGLSPNWKKTKELYDKSPECKEKRQIVYNTNEHSDGIRYKFNWRLSGVLLLNKNFYNLKFSRENKRRLSANILNGQEYTISIKNEKEV